MDLMKRRLTFGRRRSASSLDPSRPVKPHWKVFRVRSDSDSVFEEHHSPRMHSQEQSLDYMGYVHIDDLRSAREIQNAIRTVRYSTTARKMVKVTQHNGFLSVSDSNGDKLLEPALHCIHDLHQLLDCLAVTFASGPFAKQCHVFQASSNREAADVVQSLQKACRSAGKARRSAELAISFAKPAESPKLRMHFLEDEDEIIEHKPISHLSRRESKRTIIRISGETTRTSSISTSGLSSDPVSSLSRLSTSKPMPTPPKMKRKRSGTKISEREFTRQDKMNQLLNAVERVIENNNHLRHVASKSHPQNSFEDALYAIHTANAELLKNYIVTGNVAVDARDGSGNTLLHYAAAVGKVEAVRILCSYMAFLDAAGWNECRPIHRAAAEGNISVLQALLVNGANANGTDIMRRTPLHMAAGKLQLMECCIALLEYGAQITATDVLDLRPFDLSPELKETQNRLVTSACEAFSSTQFKDPGPSIVSSPSGTPTSSSPNSSRPSSIIGDHVRPHDHLMLPRPLGRSYDDQVLTELLGQVNLRAKAFKRKSQFKRSMISRSIGNLSELQEADEDEMHRKARLERLKFPSDFNLNYSTYHKLGENADNIVHVMRDLIRTGKRTSRDAAMLGGEVDALLQRDVSMSDPNLLDTVDGGGEGMVMVPRPLSSQEVLTREKGEEKVKQPRTVSIASQSSASTLVNYVVMVKEGSDSGASSPTQRMSKAFDILEEDLRRSSLREEPEGEEEIIKFSEPVQHRPHITKQLQPDSSPLMEKRSKQETEAIFDDIITELNEASESLTTATLSPRSPTSTSPEDIIPRFSIESSGEGKSDQVDFGRAQKPPESHTSKSKDHRHVRRTGSPFSRLRRGSFGKKPALGKNMSLPVEFRGPRSLSGGSSNELVPTSSSVSLEALYHGILSSPHSETSHSEPIANALKQMVTLSTNKECLSTLISYICLPKCVSRLTSLAQSPRSSPDTLTSMATLMQNIYEAGGMEGKRNALGSGILDLTIKLLQSRDPLPGTCLSLLNGLLVSEDDGDYLKTIIRIPSGPLLAYLEPYDSDADSGYERRDTSFSMTTRSSSDNQGQPPTSDEGSRPSSGLGGSTGFHTTVPPGGKFRASSFTSGTSDGSSARSPTMEGHMVTHMEARRIVLKMLALSSNHSKMQNELGTLRAVQLLIECLDDPSQENVTNATITLANIAQNIDSHWMLTQVGLPGKLRSLLPSGPRPRYHAARALVYLGELDLGGISLFEPTVYETDNVLLANDNDGHTYARGITIERCVGFLTGNISYLWGGFNLVMGLQSPTSTSGSLTPKATKEQIVDFVLTTFQSFMHPVIFMQLLLHRLASQEKGNPFDWSVEPEKSTIPPIPHSSSIPPTQMSVLNVISRWLEIFPDIFLDNDKLQRDIGVIITRLKLAKGPYIPHTHRLRSLLLDIGRPRANNSMIEEESVRVPHHENLYKLCKQMVVGGHLPVTLEQAIFMSALQLHIEEILESFKGSSTLKGRKSFSHKMKNSLPPGYGKTKNVGKRVRNQVLEFENLSERNAKHLFIERCQAMPGYECTFFSIRVPSGGSLFRRGPITKQLLGISDKHVVFLDEKTKELISQYSLSDVLALHRESEPCFLSLSLRGSALRFQVDVPALAWEIINVFEQCKEGEGWQGYDQDVRWSDSLPSLHTISLLHKEQLGDSTSSPSSNDERENSPTPDKNLSTNDVLSSSKQSPDREKQKSTPDNLGVPNSLQDQTSPSSLHMNHSPLTIANGHTPENSLKGLSRENSLGAELDSQFFPEEKAPFCDCPPDPEISPKANLKHLTLPQVLNSPIEVARQMTLIAHERLCKITAVELLQKVNLIPKPRFQQGSRTKSAPSFRSLSLSTSEHPETAIEKLAYRFNQVGNWVANAVLQFETPEGRVEAIHQFIIIAKHCMDYRNYSSMMAIVVAGLGSAPIRRLRRTWEGVSRAHMDLYEQMDTILESRSNYKNYREKLTVTSTPAVPYVGVFLKDLTFICDGNPDYLRGGLVNIHKRRQVYKKVEEIRHFQQDQYNFHIVPELRQYMLSYRPVLEDELHSISHHLEPRIQRSSSQTSARGSTVTTPNFPFFRVLTRSGSQSASNLLKTT